MLFGEDSKKIDSNVSKYNVSLGVKGCIAAKLKFKRFVWEKSFYGLMFYESLSLLLHLEYGLKISPND